MSTSTIGLLIRHMAVSEDVKRLKGSSDRDLLATYQTERSEAAFTELMRRYEALVLRTCRRILGAGPDAEDAFQATFILLARKAGQLGREAAGALSLGGWLHRVAYRSALGVVRGTTRRQARERQAKVMAIRPSSSDPAAEATWNELQPILDEELDALPEEARRLLILCYLHGKSYAEAAVELGLPRSSLAWRLGRARELLVARLARRGVRVSACLLAVLLEEAAKGAGVSAVLRVYTLRAAMSFSSQAASVVSAHVAKLVKGVLASMTKSSTYFGLVLWGWLGLLGIGLLAHQTLRAWPDPMSSTGEASVPSAAEQPAQKGEKQARTDNYGDPLAADALARMGTTRLRHNAEEIDTVLFAPDGKKVASGGGNGSVHLWDLATGKLVRSLKRPGGRPASFLRDGKTLVTLKENRIGLWDVATGEQVRELPLAVEREQQIFSLAVSSDGKMAASAGVDAVIRLWDVASGKPLRVLHKSGKSIRLLSFSPDNKTLASTGGDDKVVRLWDVSSGKLLHKLEHLRAVFKVSFAPDSKTLASGGSDQSISSWEQLFAPEGNPSAVRLWDVATGKLLHTLEGHQQAIDSLSFSRDGKMLASGSRDRTIRLWNATTGKELRTLKCHQQVTLSLSFAPDGKVLASVGMGPAVHLWDVTTGAELHRPEGAHRGQVRSVSFSPDGRTLATAAAMGEGDDTVRLWDAASGKSLRELKHPERVRSVLFSPDGKSLASGGEGMVCIWDVSNGQRLRKLEAREGPTLSGILPDGSPLAFSPDGKLLAAGFENGPRGKGTLRLWDVTSGTQLRAMEFLYVITSVAFAPDGKTLAVGTRGGVLHLWDTATGKEILKLRNLWGNVAALSFSPDGKILAAGSRDKKVHLLEASTGKELRTLTGHSDQILAVAFSPNGRLLASGSMDQTVRLWEVQAGLASQCRQFRGHAAWVTAVAFSPDGRRLASGSDDSTALIWDVTGLAADNTAHAAGLTREERTACWQSLMSTDAARAYQALRTLAAAPDQVVPFLAEHLLLKKADPRQIARLLDDLDSEDFRARSRAAKELANLSDKTVVEPALRRALQENPSLEVRRRIQQLLDELDPPYPEEASPRLLRWLRAVDLLEWIDNPAARELLKKVAAAPPRVEVGQQAEAALKRLHALAESRRPTRAE